MNGVGLTELSFDSIKEMNNVELKNLVNDHISSSAFDELQSEKVKLSKMNSLTYDKLEIQPYLTDPTLSTREKLLMFRWRMRMVKVGWNYGKKEKCPLCLQADDTQNHLLDCERLKDNDMTATNCNENVEQHSQNTHMKQLEKAIRRRQIIAENGNEETKPKMASVSNAE